MKEQLITFDTAKLAKNKGFNLNSPGYYSCDKPASGMIGNQLRLRDWEKWTNFGTEDSQEGTLIYFAPTQTLLQKWLREVHKINVESNYLPNIGKYRTLFIPMNIIPKTFKSASDHYSAVKPYLDTTNYDRYEDALEVGLQKALNLIK